MAMVSMKKDPAEEAGEDSAIEVAMDAPMYPYGLKLCLCDDTLKALGIPLPAIGQKFQIMAIAECVSASAEKVMEGAAEIRAELQITDMEAMSAGGTDPAAALWPDKE